MFGFSPGLTFIYFFWLPFLIALAFLYAFKVYDMQKKQDD